MWMEKFKNLCFFRTFFPLGCFYIPFRVIIHLIHASPQNTIYRIGEAFPTKSIARLPNGNRLIFRPFTWDMDGIMEMYSYNKYEELFHIHKGDVVVDVGAHIGIFTVKAAHSVGMDGTVVAIEPDKENYSFLIANKDINNLKNVIPICAALSNYCGKAHLYSWKGMNAGYSIKEKHSSRYIEVPVFTFDYLATKHGFYKVDFLKIDAEGAELEVLKGSEKTLKRSSAKVVIAGYHATDNSEAMRRFLESLGYNTFVSKSKFIYAYK